MHHKSLDILIQHRLSKFFLVDDFDLAGGWKGFFGGIGSVGELFLSKLDVIITKAKEGHVLNHFYADVG